MLALALWLACQPKNEPTAATPPPDVSVEAPAPPVATPPEAARPPPCGGFAGFVCPEGLACTDDPNDSCVPGRGADCLGVCLTCDDPALATARRTVATVEQCPTIRFVCDEGEVMFSDACGCGCVRRQG